MSSEVDVVVIGAGQAGLSAAYHLRRLGFGAGDGFVVLDAEDAPGGAWRHRSPSLTMATVHGIFRLPGAERPDFEPGTPAREAVPGYFARYERDHRLPVLRPVRVAAVRPAAGERLHVDGGGAEYLARGLVNATGTWRRPFVPHLPGAGAFRGRQLHYAAYRGPEEFRGVRRVLVVGGGTSAMQVLSELAEVTDTLWVTRTPPRFRADSFDAEIGRRVIADVQARVRAGLPTHSVVSVTGLPETAAVARARALGALHRQPMFSRITPDGVAWDDGRTERVDAIVWATGFRPVLDHLAPLGLREPGGGIRMDGTATALDPRVHLVGYGPSASTVGANRAGREAAVALRDLLRPRVAAR